MAHALQSRILTALILGTMPLSSSLPAMSQTTAFSRWDAEPHAAPVCRMSDSETQVLCVALQDIKLADKQTHSHRAGDAQLEVSLCYHNHQLPALKLLQEPNWITSPVEITKGRGGK